MANPQKENGHIRIASEIWQQFHQLDLSMVEWKLVHFVLWKTYGFNKKEDWISRSQFCRECKIDDSQVTRTIKKLILRKILLKNGQNVSFNKDYESWFTPPAPKQDATQQDAPKHTTPLLPSTLSPAPKQDTINQSYNKTPLQQPITTNVVTEKSEKKGKNENIDKMLLALCKHMGIDDFASTSKNKRFFGKHMHGLFEKLGKQEFLRRLDILRNDSFKGQRVNQIDFLYREMKGFVQPTNFKGKTVFIS